ncbi:MAG: aspartyl protease family protein [Acidobacteriia bacterium]|nr:aspartyl protease family protein [Terriglobia bacterium]
MLRNSVCAVLIFLLAGALYAADPNELLAKVKAASGGSAWDAIRTARTKMKVSVGGLTGTAEALDDVTAGRYVERFKLGPMSGADGFDGAVLWSQDASGQSRVEEGGDARLGAINESYRRAYGFWHAERWPAQIEDAGTQEENGRKLLIVRITPKGGRPFDLWIDSATMLIDRTVEKMAIETRTTFATDYRTVGGVKIAFAARSTNGDARYDQRATIDSVDFNESVEDAAFKLPAPPPPDFALAGGKTFTTVPFELVNNHIYVDVKLNGKGPYRLLCDTGGANIVTPELAKELGVSSEGAFEGRGVGEKSEDVGVTKVEKVEIGDATIANQVFMVFALGPFSAVEGVPQLGLVGYEVFKRFVATVDYEKKFLTLSLPSAFDYHGTGTIVPFTFNQHIPQVEGSIDGIAGKFDIDTGARDSVSILAPFAEKHGLKEHYGATVAAVTGWGVGGPARGVLTRAKTLRLGTLEVGGPVVDLSQQKKGAFTDPYVAGNVGAGVLKRFNVTFDYGRQRLIFEPNANSSRPDTYDRAGMWINRGTEGFDVVDVVAGGPAEAAGLKVGDRIISIGGTPARDLSLPVVRERLRTESVGTTIKLAVRGDGKPRELKLVLRDLVP